MRKCPNKSAKLKKSVCIAILGCILSTGASFTLSCDAAYAAEKVKDNQIKKEVKAETDAPTFLERVNRILEEARQEAQQKSKPVKSFERSEAPVSPRQEQKNIATFTPQNTYSFDWQGTPLSQTLYSISKISGKRVVINGKLSGTVYTSLHDVTYEQALNYLAKAFNFNWMLDDNGDAILISTSDLMMQDRVYEVRYADKEKVREEIKSLGIDEKNIYVNNEYGSVSVTATPYQLAQVERRIASIDKPVSQCLIVAQLIQVSHGKDLNLGMKYSLPTYLHSGDGGKDSMSGKFIDKLTFSSSMEANKAMSKGKVVARPMTMSLNGQEASIYMGDSVPVLTSTSTTASTSVTVEYKDIGTLLKVTPIINQKDSDISLKIETEISNISKWITQGSISAPQISSRRAMTSVHLKSGQSFVIGGLMNTNELDNLSGIPGLMNLPILGNLFKYHTTSKSYTEVFIMVTPYIVTDDIDPAKILREVKS